ncbi:manganese-dependent inorganic pyrophosphatase [Companilactobacillus paralimentarius DSM 13238 = JCM 10415]|uniref:Probable manganese-dependent inorganic pyrophosphatase n=3 Tax=Companilactobacillus TaxID=2767879 RepID=A0A202FFG4_9LACO|nr:MULTISPECIES: manganese-dependent inorganic pyrophosphatase [Companilactobacillus]KAE9560335.1 inorganic pyrophosphatase [Companilactobacillus bobalius]KAE9562624.1 inorganic pyrophosphatase [Companilactobacillus paralimentarius]KRK83079.1 manganese-dependent inorganic pyrophosphatase [Companilactobacillus bobalius DSM 19674]KRL32115.1 manganese-dependent inorganic pyrophosphatase [Companilactobacillus paralimentarius DSM 13238 = JCM 10415]MDR4933933.1 manganese-dependent inorganic pyrophos
MPKEKELVFGHRNPDTDAVSAAVAYSYLQNQLGYNTEAVALGEPNLETKFVYNHFDAKYPRIISAINGEVKKVMLVDHNEKQQSVPDIDDVQITHVVDHHRIANFETKLPLYYRAEPLGCVSTIIWKMYNENDVEVPAKIAALMASSIISDTLLLKSPTTTDEDRAALKSLAKTAGIDYESYGLEMLKAGTNLDSKSTQELIDMDAKSFDMKGNSVRIAQVNTVDIDDTLKREADFVKDIKAESADKGYNLFVLLITNILTSDTTGIIIGDDSAIKTFEEALNTKVSDNKASLPGVVSRKKQVVPPLDAKF